MLEFIVVVKDCQTGSVLHATFFFRDGMNNCFLNKGVVFCFLKIDVLAREVNCFNYQPFVNCSFTALIKQ